MGFHRLNVSSHILVLKESCVHVFNTVVVCMDSLCHFLVVLDQMQHRSDKHRYCLCPHLVNMHICQTRLKHSRAHMSHGTTFVEVTQIGAELLYITKLCLVTWIGMLMQNIGSLAFNQRLGKD